ncbi:hypothetical protein A2U01_0052313, partial [Trifolium medium]|nr:hypothetical protein [Trifolium medium]
VLKTLLRDDGISRARITSEYFLVTREWIYAGHASACI